MSETTPTGPETLSALARVLMADGDVMEVDICEDAAPGLASSWAEVTATSLAVPDAVVQEVARSYSPFELYDVEHRNGHVIITVLGPIGTGADTDSEADQ